MRRLVAAALAVLCAGQASADTRDTTLNGWFELPVPGGPATLTALEIHADERALTLPILARAVYDRHSRLGRDPLRLTQVLQAAAVPAVGEVVDAPAITVPAPLDAETWRALLAVQPHEDLFTRLVTDNAALLVAVGLMSTDPSVRALFPSDRDLLRDIHRQWAGPFVIAARSLRLVDGQIVVPGGEHADAIWTRLAGEPPSRPAAFVRALVSRDAGRLAWYFDTVASLEPGRLPLMWPGGSVTAARESAAALYDAFRQSEPQWHALEQPFKRSFGDASTVLTVVESHDGRLVGPPSQAFWEQVFSGRSVDASTLAAGPALSVARLARLVTLGTARERRERLESYRLAQRVFPRPAAGQLSDIAEALSGYPRYRALLLALERMGVDTPATWAAVVGAARHVDERANDREAATIAFQATIALLDRIRHVRAIDVATADRVLRALGDGVRRDKDVAAAIGEWIRTSLMQALPALDRPDAWTGTTAYESRVLQALAGPRDRPTPDLEWEGLAYRVDLVAAEHDRVREIRAQLPSPGLDQALRRGRPRDLAEALTALAYAPALGEPDGAVALSRDVARRHDFGFASTSIVRELRPYALPEEQQGFGPWRVHGSLIGLDLGLARLAVRRVASDQMPPAPTLTLNDFATLSRTVVAMVAADLTDAERDEIARTIAAGRRRVDEAAHSVSVLDAMAREVRLSAVTRQLIPWMVARQPDMVGGLFSLRDLLWLGRPSLSQPALDRWGVAGDAYDGRRTTLMPRPAPWEDFAGRADVGQITTQTPDLTLRMIEETARMRLPAMLVPSLLAFAMNDYWHDTQIRFADDWLGLTRQARALDATRVEDYVAALAGRGPLRAR